MLQPVAGSVAGCVTLKNGAPAIRIGGPYATAASAEVAVKNKAGQVVAGPVPVNGAGCYVVTNVPSEDGLSVDAQYEQAEAVQALGAGAPHAAVNIVLPTSAPSIASFTATLDGKVVSEAAPGSTVTAQVRATSPENYPLHYKWADSTGAPLPGDQPTQQWPLPRTNSLNFIYVEVADSHGGATRASLSVATGPMAATSTAPAAGVSPLAVPAVERFVIINPVIPVVQPGGIPQLPHPSYPPPLTIFPNNNGYQFLDPGIFMDNLGTCPPGNGSAQGCEDEAIKYYKNLEVFDSAGQATGSFVNFKTWKASWGFSDDPRTPTPNTELRAVYYNNADLQFGRDMHCLKTSSVFGSIVGTACYVANYSDTSGKPGGNPEVAIANAEQNNSPIAAVAMIGYNSPTTHTSSVYFLVFVPPPVSSGIDDFVPSTNANLDSQGKKDVPGVCMACHGGSYSTSTQGLSSVSNAQFLPFDTPSFLYDQVNTDFSEAAQSETFRQLNSVVRTIDFGVTGSSQVTSQTTTDLIDGWYSWCGGVGKAGCSIDDVNHPFIPSATCTSPTEPATCGWNGGTTDLLRGPAYQQGPRVECRTCHVAHSDQFNWQNYLAFVQQVQTVKSGQAVGNVCRYLENYYMPLAQVPYDRLWGSNVDQNTFEYLINTAWTQACDVMHHIP